MPERGPSSDATAPVPAERRDVAIQPRETTSPSRGAVGLPLHSIGKSPRLSRAAPIPGAADEPTESGTFPLAMRLVAEPSTSPPTTSRNVGILVSAVGHFCFVLGLALILGPAYLGPDEPLQLDMAVSATVVPEILELDAPIDAQLTTFELEPSAAVPTDLARGAVWSHTGVVGGSGQGQRGTFFGTVAYGNQFVYVLDMSGSMNQTRDPKYNVTRFEYAVDELLRSIGELSEDQYFYIVLFSTNLRPMFDEESLLPQPISATKENKERLRKWIAEVRPGSGTDPRAALRMALKMQPSAVFLLSDGEFNGQRHRTNANLFHGNPSVEEVVDQHNLKGTPINTIAYEDPKTRERMEALATRTRGDHRYVPPLKIPGQK